MLKNWVVESSKDYDYKDSRAQRNHVIKFELNKAAGELEFVGQRETELLHYLAVRLMLVAYVMQFYAKNIL